ncbi:MAG: bifunctional ornithine acetyltransferase/N-acetylglutamate synthase [Spirochaetota bacterium]
MEVYTTEAEYIKAVQSRAVLPVGFRAASIPLTFSPMERPVHNPLPMSLNVILLDNATPSFGGVFTRNSFPGAPILINKTRLSQRAMRGVLINNKVANVCAENGVEDAELLLNNLARLIRAAKGSEVSGEQFFSASTGIIGWKLPVKEILEALPRLVDHLGLGDLQAESFHGGNDRALRSIFSVAKGIMTTDAFPKVRAANVGSGRIVGIAKGAGMIEPNMATLLVFLMTDLAVERTLLRRVLRDVIAATFNRISIDGDQSTSDMVLLFSSMKKSAVSEKEFKDGLFSVCRHLAFDIVRNGEGTGHVIRVKVKGASNAETALGIGKSIINSPLVKTAVFGNDPNVGRIIMAVGDYTGNKFISLVPEKITLTIGGEIIFLNGSFHLNADTENYLNHYMQDASLKTECKNFPEHERCVDITVDLGPGKGEAEVVGSDLSYEYIRENADYRT